MYKISTKNLWNIKNTDPDIYDILYTGVRTLLGEITTFAVETNGTWMVTPMMLQFLKDHEIISEFVSKDS